MTDTIDLRSDTVTQPTDSMRQAMAHADVGDNVFDEDPTVKQLEETAADRLKKEAALFVPSGTMANLASILTHCHRGDEIILGHLSHIFIYEQGGCAALGGIMPHTIANQPDGRLEPADILGAIREDNVHFPRTRLIALENTHNRCHGMPLPMAYLQQVAQLAADRNLKIHMDGARIFNAAAALNVPVDQLAQMADSVSFCLSKGLCAPAGSLICGKREFIDQALRYRKVLGGGMRQSGILAAAGLVALQEMTDRLAQDHENAHHLACGLAETDGLTVDVAKCQTNIVYIDIDPSLPPAVDMAQALAARGILILPTSERQIRAVTHHPISRRQIERAVDGFKDVRFSA